MAVKLADTLAPMGDFEIAKAKDVSIELTDGSTSDVETVLNVFNDSLVDLESALDDKADVSELAGLKRRYNTIEELNAIKKKSLTLVNGEDNTQKVLDALDDGEVLSDYFSNGGSTSRFGIDNSLGTYFIITFEKNGSGYAKITAKSTTSNTVLVRYHNANELSAWQELATMDKVPSIIKETTSATKTYSLDGRYINNIFLGADGSNQCNIMAYIYRDTLCISEVGGKEIPAAITFTKNGNIINMQVPTYWLVHIS